MMGLLAHPGPEHLPEYAAALEKGWSPNTTRDVSAEELASIKADATAFLATMDDPKALAGDVKMPDGTMVKRLPGLKRFIWDQGFCGIINLRWQDGTDALPSYCSGHIGYSVVPWKRGCGYATRALAEILPVAREIGLGQVEISTDVDNIASQRVITANGGALIKEIDLPGTYGHTAGLLYIITL